MKCITCVLVPSAGTMTHFQFEVTNKTVLDRYMRLAIPNDKCQAMYVWVDGSGEHLRSKTRTLHFIPKTPAGEDAVLPWLVMPGSL